jgi:hypothetical protein
VPSPAQPERTQVGIAEWARRARGARAVELQLAEALAHAIPSASSGAAKARLAAAARRHGRRAELWDAVVPALHDLDDDLAPVDGLDSVAAVAPGDDPQAVAGVAGQLAGAYRAWLAEATRVADAPVIGVLDLVLRDDGAAGAL